MWATDPAPNLGRVLGVGLVALRLTALTPAASAAPPAVTDADIERARQLHRMPTDADLARIPGPSTPRIENLPQPPTQPPIDLEAISKGFDLPIGTRPTARSIGRPETQVLIFVSLAMPEVTLQRLLDQASRAKATLVLRGLVNGSIRETVIRMQSLIGSRRVGVQIDPEAFDRYGIERTPTFVLVNASLGTETCATRRCDHNLMFAKISGDVSLDYALKYLTRGAAAETRPRP